MGHLRRIAISVAFYCVLLGGAIRAEAPSTANDEPRPTPVTRPEMKRMLEDMKQRSPRIPLPEPTTEEQQDPSSADPRSRGYEARLARLYLPAAAGARSYLNFSGSRQRAGAPSLGNRVAQEADPLVTLDYGFKTRLFWLASRANNCQYCLGHQESKLLAVGMSDDQIAALDTDWTSFPAEEQAAFALARRLTLEPHLLTAADVEQCRPYFTELQILELVLSVAGNNAINRWKEGTGVPQSAGGGSFGGSGPQTNSQEVHSYLTQTSDGFQTTQSVVVALADSLSDNSLSPTLDQRPAKLTSSELHDLLSAAVNRMPRLPVVDEATARQTLGEVASAGPLPGWMRLLANFPVAGKRQAASIRMAEEQLDLDPLLLARMAWVVASNDRAWYAMGEARHRLAGLGQSDTQIERLTDDLGDLPERERALLVVAKNLAASPVVLTDKQVADAVRLAGPRDVVQAIHYTAMRAQFNRFTEAAGLPIDAR